jgi:hypothetical protein
MKIIATAFLMLGLAGSSWAATEPARKYAHKKVVKPVIGNTIPSVPRFRPEPMVLPRVPVVIPETPLLPPPLRMPPPPGKYLYYPCKGRC